MMTLNTCRWTPRWVSHLGCLKGCLDFLDIEISDAWLYGGTGHAFVINLHEGVCPSGPTAWNTSEVFQLGRNLGYQFEGVFGFKHQGDLAELQDGSEHQPFGLVRTWVCERGDLSSNCAAVAVLNNRMCREPRISPAHSE